MYLDTVVVAGLLTVGLIFAFFGGIAWYVHQDMKAHPAQSAERQERR